MEKRDRAKNKIRT